MSRLRSEQGFALLELAVGGMLAALTLAALGMFLAGSFENGTFTQGQSATLDDVREVMQKMEKEIRGADSIVWCDNPVGNCLVVGAQTSTGAFRTLRYTKSGTELRREVFNSGLQSYGPPLAMVERVANTASQPVFSCDEGSTLLRVNIDLHVEPTPRSDPNLNVHTSIRPRNFASRAVCPAP